MNHFDTAALSAFLQIGVSRKTLRTFLKHFGNLAQAWQQPTSALGALSESSDREKLELRTDEMLEALRKKCEDESISSITFGDDSYPVLLQEISSAPFGLFVKGDQSLLSSLHPVAVVGTRMISSYGKQVLHTIIPPLAKSGVTIVSGLAYGVDSLAHEIALEYNGKCLAVLGSGVDVVYPAGHRNLAKRILENGGTIVSELPLGMQPLPKFFPARNRIISGLSKATVVVEAKEESGSLITAQFALEQNRDVYAVPGSIFTENQQGTNLLIAQGAYPLLKVETLLQQLQLSNKPSVAPVLQFDSVEEKTLYESLQEPRSLDELAELKHIDVTQISQILSLLELKGFVRSLGQRYVRC